MTQPLWNGIPLPRNDFEGDDATPGAGGKWVTCVDTASGSEVAFKTRGRIVKDGKVYRDALRPRDPDGITLEQVAQAIHSVTGLHLVIPKDWGWSEASHHLMTMGGLIAIGHYSAFPRAQRYQDGADFDHGMWFSHRSLKSGVRAWDALNPNKTGYGRWYPAGAVRKFLESGADDKGHLQVAYLAMQPK